ncbi:MAG: penicillin-binding protein 1B [Kangiellaceae bacterium]|nr:penicillin-binding protein 1B [Kangiellaceae bacterium]
MSGKKKTGSQSQPKQSLWQRFKSIFWKLALIGTVLLFGFVIYCDSLIQKQFKENRWQLPAKVYAQPLEIISGKRITPTRIKQELDLLGYRKVIKATRPGDYEQYGEYYYIFVREFQFWDGVQRQQEIAFSIKDGKVEGLKDHVNGQLLQMARLDPVLAGQIYPNKLEDRILVKLEDIPDHLKKALLLTEDNDFYDHKGVSAKAIARAFWHNLTSKGGMQGGSTITQQLVKNYFLTNERSLWRKFREAVMAVILEMRYEKDEILQAYFNEVFFGQDRSRAIHGVGLASSFFFDKNVQELTPAQSALLVAILKGPSLYDPRRNPENALKRRNLVLRLLNDAGVLNEQEYQEQRDTTLSVVSKPKLRLSKVPAFMDLVKRQLKQSYSDEELNSVGLNIFTTLDPVIQRYAEQAVERAVTKVEKNRGIETNSLQAASIITDSQSGKILAVIGDRKAGFSGFNRALDANRQIGSVIKPFVVLAALEKSNKYTLATKIDDQPLSLKQRDGSTWQPRNYDKKYHGNVPLFEVLTKSYNIAMARLGQQIGIENVAEFIEQAGVDKDVPALDALPLGVLEMSPLELTELYQSLASNGYRIKPSSIIAVTNNQGELLERYPVESKRIASELNTYLVQANMQMVVERGTGKFLHQRNPFTSFAGKTGTTNDLKDSWFAGFSGEHLAIVWVGRDDNQDANISGSTAALPVFSEIFDGINTESLRLGYDPEIEWKLIDVSSGLLASDGCKNVSSVPFVRGSAPKQYANCL